MAPRPPDRERALSARESAELFDWALPRLGLDPGSFGRLGKQVTKRIGRRVTELHLASFAEYHRYLQAHPAEWAELDRLCFVTITRFFRDARAFALVESKVLPELARLPELRVWSAGAAGGEEAFSLALLWHFRFGARHPDVRFGVLATELDTVSLERARARRYPPGCLREVPDDIRAAAFVPAGRLRELRAEHAEGVRFEHADLRRELPPGPFELIACRNVAFTYFDRPTQQRVLAGLVERLVPGGFLWIGRKEQLPLAHPLLLELEPGSRLQVFRKTERPEPAGASLYSS